MRWQSNLFIPLKEQCFDFRSEPSFHAWCVPAFGLSSIAILNPRRYVGDHHRKQRKMLNPVFSLKHMRDLLPIFYPIAYDVGPIHS